MTANRIKEIRKSRGQSQQYVADRAGTTKATIMKLETGQMKLTTEWMARIANALECVASDLIAEERQQVPVIGIVGAGGEVFPVDDMPLIKTTAVYDKKKYYRGENGDPTDPVEYVDMPDGVYGSDVVALKIKGDSMYPFKDGWLVFYKQRQSGAFSGLVGQLVVAKIKGGATVFKTLRNGASFGKYTLDSHNAAPIENVELEWAAKVESIKPV